MSCIFLSSKFRESNGVDSREKYFTPIKKIIKKAKNKRSKELVKKKTKVQGRCISEESPQKLDLSPLLTVKEKKCVKFGKTSLGYWTNESVNIAAVSEYEIESCELTNSNSDDEEYIFHEKQFHIANRC